MHGRRAGGAGRPDTADDPGGRTAAHHHRRALPLPGRRGRRGGRRARGRCRPDLDNVHAALGVLPHRGAPSTARKSCERWSAGRTGWACGTERRPSTCGSPFDQPTVGRACRAAARGAAESAVVRLFPAHVVRWFSEHQAVADGPVGHAGGAALQRRRRVPGVVGLALRPGAVRRDPGRPDDPRAVPGVMEANAAPATAVLTHASGAVSHVHGGCEQPVPHLVPDRRRGRRAGARLRPYRSRRRSRRPWRS